MKNAQKLLYILCVHKSSVVNKQTNKGSSEWKHTLMSSSFIFSGCSFRASNISFRRSFSAKDSLSLGRFEACLILSSMIQSKVVNSWCMWRRLDERSHVSNIGSIRYKGWKHAWKILRYRVDHWLSVPSIAPKSKSERVWLASGQGNASILSIAVFSYIPKSVFPKRSKAQWFANRCQFTLPLSILPILVISFWPIASHDSRGLAQSNAAFMIYVFQVSILPSNPLSSATYRRSGSSIIPYVAQSTHRHLM